MSWTNVKELYGFKQPFNFKVAIPFLINAVMLGILLIVCAVLATKGDLTVGTGRFYFIFYISAVLVLAMLISTLPLVSYSLAVWCLIELTLAAFTTVYSPKDQFPEPVDPRFSYHPLLQNVPAPNIRWRWHVSEREIASGKSQFPNVALNWAEFQHDFIFTQNSLGLRGLEPTRQDLAKPLIFVYGGSTTYDITVTQGKTWVERLQADLHGKYTILNFGVPGYSTTEHLIQTTFYQGIAGKKPVCAVYYIGWNDIHNAHTDLDDAYAKFHLPLQAVRAPDLYLAKYSPFVRLVNELAKRRFDSLPPQPRLDAMGSPIAGTDARLERIYVDHVSTLKSINEGRGIRTIFIGQILNREFFKGDRIPGDWTPLVRYEDMWPIQDRFNHLLKNTVESGSPSRYIDAGIENFRASDFTDEGHFSAAGSEKFASLVSEQVSAYCQ